MLLKMIEIFILSQTPLSSFRSILCSGQQQKYICKIQLYIVFVSTDDISNPRFFCSVSIDFQCESKSK